MGWEGDEGEEVWWDGKGDEGEMKMWWDREGDKGKSEVWWDGEGNKDEAEVWLDGKMIRIRLTRDRTIWSPCKPPNTNSLNLMILFIFTFCTDGKFFIDESNRDQW